MPYQIIVLFANSRFDSCLQLVSSQIGKIVISLGSDAAIEAADMVIMNDQPSKLAQVIRISRKSMTIVRENIVFALGIKALVLILSALGSRLILSATVTHAEIIQKHI